MAEARVGLDTIICPGCDGSGEQSMSNFAIHSDGEVVVTEGLPTGLACWRCDGAGVVEWRP